MATMPGDYITARCGSCNDITGHVVMLVLDGAIAKVECKACGSVHKYRETRLKTGTARQSQQPQRKVRDKDGNERIAAVDERRERVTGLSSARKAPTGTKRPAPTKMFQAWQEAMARHNTDIAITYSMQGTFAPQTLIEHPSFGRGEVIAVTPPDKMEVLFEQGVKVLRCCV